VVVADSDIGIIAANWDPLTRKWQQGSCLAFYTRLLGGIRLSFKKTNTARSATKCSRCRARTKFGCVKMPVVPWIWLERDQRARCVAFGDPRI